MEVKSEELKEGVLLVKIGGYVDGSNSLELGEELSKLVDNFGENTPKIIVDLESLPRMDAAGLGVLVSLQNSVSKKKGRLVLLKPNKWIKNLLAITQAESLMNIYESLEVAQSSFES